MNALFDKLNPLFNVASRVLMSLLFIMAGASKIPAEAYTGTQGYMAAMGVPGAVLPLVIATELGGGLLLLLGFQTRLVAFLLAGFTLLSALIFHTQFSDQMQSIMFMKNLSIAGGLLLFVQYGGGRFSVDHR